MQHAEAPGKPGVEIRNDVRLLRRQRGTPRPEVAKALGVGDRMMSAIEAQKFVPSLLFAYQLADYFEVEPYELFYRAEEAAPTSTEVKVRFADKFSEWAGGLRNVQLLVILFDRGPTTRALLARIMQESPKELDTYLEDLESSGLVMANEEGPRSIFLGREKFFTLHEQTRHDIAETYRTRAEG
jgi:DNA-binding XRE family transcriptional regulator